MIVQSKLEKKECPHCWGKKICDCKCCGQRAWYIDFGGKLFRYYESARCRVCGGKGMV
jgi:hypothetical protein